MTDPMTERSTAIRSSSSAIFPPAARPCARLAAAIALLAGLSGCAVLDRLDAPPQLMSIEDAEDAGWANPAPVPSPAPRREPPLTTTPRPTLVAGAAVNRSGAPDLRDKAVWAACRPQAIAERCLAYDPQATAIGESFRGWRRRNSDGLKVLYTFIASQGGVLPGDVDRSPLSTRRGDAKGRADVTHENVMIRYCENAAEFFDDNPDSNLTFPSVGEIAELAGQPAAPAQDVDAVRAACEAPLPRP